MITTLAFVTADRPLAFHRSLGSYREHCRVHHRQVGTLVADDSRSSAARRKYLESLARSDNQGARYSGRLEKLKYIKELGRQGIDPAVASFAIGGHFPPDICTIGANRNCVLLDTIGELILTADDDTICTVVSHPHRDELVTIGNHENPREAWFYLSRNEAIPGQLSTSSDLLASHERLLGRSLPEISAEAGPSRINVDASCNHLLAALQRTDARVVATMTGMAGDSGAENPQCFLLGSKQVLAKLNESEATSRRAFASREVLWVARSHTITHGPQCQAAGLGLANDDLLPPFFPVGRNEDAVFGALNLIARNSFLAHLPFALLHAPEDTRHYQRLPSFSIANLILSLVWNYSPRPKWSATSAGALRSLGHNFLEVARLPQQQFWEAVTQAVHRQAARTLRVLKLNRATIGECSSYLETEIEDYQMHLRELINKNSRQFIPYELQKQLPMELAAANTQQLVQDAGKMWCAWPDLVEAATFLRGRDVRISVHPSRL